MPLKKAVLIEVVFLFVGAAFFLPGGQDLDHLYQYANGCLSCAYEPPFGSWLLFPLRFIPTEVRWPLWTLLTCLALIWSSRRFGVEPLWVLLSFPAVGHIWLGQLDGFVALGIALAVTAPHPFARGFGLLVMAVKPQVAGPAILLLLWRERDKLRTLAIPVAVMLLSFVAWDVDWPVRWLFEHNEPADMNLIPWRLASRYPVGLLAFLVVPWLKTPRDQLRATLLATALGFPFYSSYSYVTFLVIGAPWWSVPLSYAWALAYPWLGREALQFAWVLPLALLTQLVWPVLLVRFRKLALAH